mmetsp:Transcript_59458/g.179674  ORF Transcript_59458/g.179674 Transcript_59458/m.179674 type:complete len:507 (+) Transcript_59458:2-1522(+)
MGDQGGDPNAWAESAPAEPSGDVLYNSGQEVFAFFQSQSDPTGHRWTQVSDEQCNWPYVGCTAGWVKATVLDDFRPAESATVRLNFQGWWRDSRLGIKNGLEAQVDPYCVRPEQGEEPRLSVLLLRWVSRTGWSDCDVANDGMVSDLLIGHCGVDEALRGFYTTHTLWISNSVDCISLSRFADFLRSLLKAPSVSGWYFVRPTRRADAEGVPGCVEETHFFNLVQKLERAGIPGDWPQVPWLHRQLVGKLWAPQMCSHPGYRVPATTRVHYAEHAARGPAATQRALEVLAELGQESGLNPGVPPAQLRGVAKLGFSCSGDAELPFCGPEELAAVLNRLFLQPGSNDNICLVQEAVPDVVCEFRVICFRDAAVDGFARECLWVRREGLERQGGTDPGIVVEQDTALAEFFGGSEALLQEAVAAGEAVADKWLLWLCNESSEPPATARMDFLVQLSQERGVGVWTWELGECGGSLCGLKTDARNAAVLNTAMCNDTSGHFPKPLPPLR